MSSVNALKLSSNRDLSVPQGNNRKNTEVATEMR